MKTLNNRKQIIITDDNFDEEFEKICDKNNYPYGHPCDFVKEPPEGFSKQSEDVDYDYAKVSISPNHAIDCISNIENYWIAYEFANGFMIFHERDSMFD